jgi:hypothetical protein
MNNNDEIISIFLNVSMCFAKTLLHRCYANQVSTTAIGIHNYSVHPGAINLYIKTNGKTQRKNTNMCMEQLKSILDNVFIV